MKHLKLVVGATGLALMGAGIWLVPPAIEAANLLLHPDNSEAITEHRLQAEPPERVAAAIERALTDGDQQLAASLLEVAIDMGSPMSQDLIARVTDAQGFDAGRMVGEIWTGITQGDASSEAALGGALAADFTGLGDARDLIQEGSGFLADGTYDPVVLTLATAGLALTVATVLTGGAGAPARTGVTVLKAAKKADNLPAPLVAEFITLSQNAIDRAALSEALTLAKGLDLGGAGTAARRVLRPAVLETVTRTADDVAGLASGQGYRAVNQSLKIAESTADISKLRSLATSTGTKFRGIVALLGKSAITLVGITLQLASWVVFGLVWLLAVGVFALGIFRGVFRIFGRRRHSAPSAA